MRMSDWSSDVCSSDLAAHDLVDPVAATRLDAAGSCEHGSGQHLGCGLPRASRDGDEGDAVEPPAVPGRYTWQQERAHLPPAGTTLGRGEKGREHQIGRASWRERVCPDV